MLKDRAVMQVKAADGGVSTITKEELQDLSMEAQTGSVVPALDDIFFEIQKKRQALQCP